MSSSCHLNLTNKESMTCILMLIKIQSSGAWRLHHLVDPVVWQWFMNGRWSVMRVDAPTKTSSSSIHRRQIYQNRLLDRMPIVHQLYNKLFCIVNVRSMHPQPGKTQQLNTSFTIPPTLLDVDISVILNLFEVNVNEPSRSSQLILILILFTSRAIQHELKPKPYLANP